MRHYAIDLDLTSSGAQFSGVVELECTTEAATFTLNTQELTIQEVSVDGAPAGFVLDPSVEELRVDVGSVGSHLLRIVYEGTILEPGYVGLYRSAFGPGKIITSMMYPTGARRVFPCVDHPAAKAVFEVTVQAPSGALVIFNTPAAQLERTGDRQRVRFQPTPPMSTYLVYLAVGAFAELRGRSAGTEMLVALPPGRESAGSFALEHGSRVLAAFNDYYGMPYVLPKLHLVSVPAFWAGAMENWGAIAFRETALLVDGSTSARTRRGVRETISHEIAHQWFGNLVTMRWWNDFWLNEAFATLMQSTMDDRLYPDLDTWSEFQVRWSRGALDGDAYLGTHPIRVEVEKPSELGQIADDVTYGKGASVLRMIEGYVGAEPFRSGVQLYLERHQYGNTQASDLWAAIEERAGRPVERIMRSWIELPGFPIVSASVEDGSLRLNQRRFAYLSGASPGIWPLPLTVRIGSERHELLLEGTELRAPVPPDALVVLNPGRTGFFRAEYDRTLSERIDAGYDQLDELDRWGLLSDAAARMFEGSLAPAHFAAELERAGPSAGYLAASEVALTRESLGELATSQPDLARGFREFFRRSLERTGLEPQPGEGELLGRMRSRSLLGRARTDAEFARSLGARFAFYESESPDLRLPIAVSYGLSSDARSVPALEARMGQARSEDEASQIGLALSAIPDPAAAARVLERLLQPEIPANRACLMLREMRGNGAALPELRQWMFAHLGEFDRQLTGTPLLSIYISEVIGAVGLGHRTEVKEFFATHPFPEANRGIAKGLEWLEVLERLRQRWS
ncbi:MAG: M1 family metallopeptidase [Thermoplasmata archaeon]|nr:M1 family metallopeptidase [Thermoplasmata archaeon]